MNVHRFRFLLLPLAASALAASMPAASPPSIFIATLSEVPTPFETTPLFPAGDYFALTCRPSCELKKAKVAIQPAKVMTLEGEVNGFLATAHSPDSSHFLIRGLPNLHEGPVKTWYVRQPPNPAQMHMPDFKQPQVKTLDVDGSPLTLFGKVTFNKETPCSTGSDCAVYPTISWHVKFGQIERTLNTESGDELYTPSGVDEVLYWVGDLDGDGKPDIMVYQDNDTTLALYLSSTLAPGKPWRPAATYYYWDPENAGC